MFKSACNLLRKRQLIAAASKVRVSNFVCPPKFLNSPQNPTSVVRFFCESANNVSNQKQSATLSYLINSCGLSPEAAAVASTKLILRSPERADSVLTVLKENGLSDAHIIKLIQRFPVILSARPEKTILPKLRFFQSIGMPASVLGTMIYKNPSVLKTSLEKSIIPLYNYLKNLLQKDEKVIKVYKRSFFTRTALHRIPANVNVLRKYGVSDSNISLLVASWPSTLLKKSDDLIKLVERVLELGIDISKSVFVWAVYVLSYLNKAAWERREEVYRKWGWSGSDIHMAFSLEPSCMRLSEKKIMSVMQFLVNEMNCPPKDIARCPYILLFNLDKRITPRCRVAKLLMAKGFIKKSHAFYRFVRMTENEFLETYVRKYDNLPELLAVYRGQYNLPQLRFQVEQPNK